VRKNGSSSWFHSLSYERKEREDDIDMTCHANMAIDMIVRVTGVNNVFD
jgi:hypothetical protein